VSAAVIITLVPKMRKDLLPAVLFMPQINVNMPAMLIECSCKLLYIFALQIKVKRRGDDQKFLARVLAIGVECDMALLTGDRGGGGA
jgi:hypothetical protein